MENASIKSKKRQSSSARAVKAGARIGNKKALPKTVRVQYRVDRKRKKEAEAILKGQGIKPSQALEMFFAQVVNERGFPFKPCPFPNCGIPNEETAKALEGSAKGIGVETYQSAEEMFEALKKL